MAFRKKFTPRRSPFKRSRFHRRGSRFAKKKYDLVTLVDTFETCTPSTTLGCDQGNNPSPCGPGVADCCVTGITAPIISNKRLQGSGPPNVGSATVGLVDDVRIVRLIGDIWIRDVINYEGYLDNCTAAGNQPSLQDYVENYALLLRLGIHRAYASQSGLDGADPAFDESNPAVLFDWTESRWLWLRQVYWEPTPRFGTTRMRGGSILGPCSNVHGGADNIVPPEASGSQPTYDIDTRVSTDCTFPTAPNEGCLSKSDYAEAQPPPLFHFRFSLGIRQKRGLRLRDDEQLNLQIGWKHPVSTKQVDGSNKGWGCNCVTDPDNGRCFEQSQITAHMCAKAIIQLN